MPLHDLERPGSIGALLYAMRLRSGYRASKWRGIDRVRARRHREKRVDERSERALEMNDGRERVRRVDPFDVVVSLAVADVVAWGSSPLPGENDIARVERRPSCHVTPFRRWYVIVRPFARDAAVCRRRHGNGELGDQYVSHRCN